MAGVWNTRANRKLKRMGTAIIAVLALAALVRAEDDVEQRMQRIEEQNQRFQQQLDALMLQQAQTDEAHEAVARGEAFGHERMTPREHFASQTGRARLGGYMDLEYHDRQGANRRFLQHRLVPFIAADITDQVHFAAEIEFEYGGPQSAGDDGEVKVEFAALDWAWSEAFGWRAGALLVPLGKFNLIHDSPVNDLTDRPLVDRRVIPTTFTEPGFGVFGTWFPGDSQVRLDYELYLVQGFDGLSTDGETPVANITASGGVRGARPSLKSDNNNAFALTGRLAVSPWLGTEIAGSFHSGAYDDAGENNMTIAALDWMFQPGRFVDWMGGIEFLGEYAQAIVDRNDEAKAAGIADELSGYYAQLNFHFMPGFLLNLCDEVLRPEATFTLVGRYGALDLDGNKNERMTLGLNFRPVEDTVFKFDYQQNYEDGEHNEIENDAFLFSAATYF